MKSVGELWLGAVNAMPPSENFIQEKYFKEPLEEKSLKPICVRVDLDGKTGEKFSKVMWDLQLKVLLRKLEALIEKRVKEEND